MRPPDGRPPSSPPRDLAVAILAVAALAFAALAIATVFTREDRLPFDPAVARAIQGPSSLLDPARFFSFIGGSVVATIFGLGLGLLFLCFGRRDLALVALLAQPLRATSILWKLLLERDRPSAEFVTIHEQLEGTGFPSGHATTAVLVYGLLVVAAMRVHGPARIAVLAAGLAAVLGIGASRVVLGVHWPSDVLGGWLSGTATLALLLVVMRRFAGGDGAGEPAKDPGRSAARPLREGASGSDNGQGPPVR